MKSTLRWPITFSKVFLAVHIVRSFNRLIRITILPYNKLYSTSMVACLFQNTVTNTVKSVLYFSKILTDFLPFLVYGMIAIGFVLSNTSSILFNIFLVKIIKNQHFLCGGRDFCSIILVKNSDHS